MKKRNQIVSIALVFLLVVLVAAADVMVSSVPAFATEEEPVAVTVEGTENGDVEEATPEEELLIEEPVFEEAEQEYVEQEQTEEEIAFSEDGVYLSDRKSVV